MRNNVVSPSGFGTVFFVSQVKHELVGWPECYRGSCHQLKVHQGAVTIIDLAHSSPYFAFESDGSQVTMPGNRIMISSAMS